MEFKTSKYGIERTFHVGQKVKCFYYHEFDNDRLVHYKRPWYQKIFDEPFEPVKHGVIVGDAGFHDYYLSSGKKERYLFVKFKEYIFPKAIPISCMDDAKSAAESMIRYLENNSHKIGQKGYDKESRDKLISIAHDGLNF